MAWLQKLAWLPRPPKPRVAPKAPKAPKARLGSYASIWIDIYMRVARPTSLTPCDSRSRGVWCSVPAHQSSMPGKLRTVGRPKHCSQSSRSSCAAGLGYGIRVLAWFLDFPTFPPFCTDLRKTSDVEQKHDFSNLHSSARKAQTTLRQISMQRIPARTSSIS